MKFFNRVALLFASVAMLSSPAVAQEDIDQFLKESVADGQKLVGAYIGPFMKSVSLSLNQGWYNTAKPHKIVGVDLTVTVNAMAIPDDEMFYNVPSLKLAKIGLHSSSPNFSTGKAPTLFGPDSEPVFTVTDPQSPSYGEPFSGPGGIDMKKEFKTNKLPVPVAHLGIGLPKSTDIKIRFVPSLNLGEDGTFKLFGIGVMHDIKQWIPGIKLLPFDLSGFVGFTKLDMQYKLDASNLQNADQLGVLSVKATTIQGVISKKFSVITFYGGLGYNIAKSNIALKGSYDFDQNGSEETKNPVNLDFAASGFRGTIGTRLKLAIFTFHADYTLQKYKCLTVGFGLSVR